MFLCHFISNHLYQTDTRLSRPAVNYKGDYKQENVWHSETASTLRNSGQVTLLLSLVRF